jgi:hypothetical protein
LQGLSAGTGLDERGPIAVNDVSLTVLDRPPACVGDDVNVGLIVQVAFGVFPGGDPDSQNLGLRPKRIAG